MKLKDFFFDELGWCGCGQPAEAMRFMGKVLELMNKRSEAASLKDDSYQHLWNQLTVLLGTNEALALSYLYMLDAAELTEHGVSVSGSWLTPKGIKVLKAINEQVTDTWPGDDD